MDSRKLGTRLLTGLLPQMVQVRLMQIVQTIHLLVERQRCMHNGQLILTASHTMAMVLMEVPSLQVALRIMDLLLQFRVTQEL